MKHSNPITCPQCSGLDLTKITIDVIGTQSAIVNKDCRETSLYRIILTQKKNMEKLKLVAVKSLKKD